MRKSLTGNCKDIAQEETDHGKADEKINFLKEILYFLLNAGTMTVVSFFCRCLCERKARIVENAEEVTGNQMAFLSRLQPDINSIAFRQMFCVMT